MDKESAIEILECIKDDFSDMMPECLKAINYAIETLKNLSELEILENASRKIALMTNEMPERVYNDIINTLPKINADSFKIYSIKRIIKKYDDMNLTISHEERRENHVKAYMEIKNKINDCEKEQCEK